MSWSSGKLVNVEVLSVSGGVCRLSSAAALKLIGEDGNGSRELEFTTESGKIYSFTTV